MFDLTRLSNSNMWIASNVSKSEFCAAVIGNWEIFSIVCIKTEKKRPEIINKLRRLIENRGVVYATRAYNRIKINLTHKMIFLRLLVGDLTCTLREGRYKFSFAYTCFLKTTVFTQQYCLQTRWLNARANSTAGIHPSRVLYYSKTRLVSVFDLRGRIARLSWT